MRKANICTSRGEHLTVELDDRIELDVTPTYVALWTSNRRLRAIFYGPAKVEIEGN